MQDPPTVLHGLTPRELRRLRSRRLSKARGQRWRHRLRRLKRASLASSAILVAVAVQAILTDGLGAAEVIFTFFAMIAAFMVFAIYPRTRTLAVNKAGAMDLPGLLGQTPVWLDSQRRLLPPPAQEMVDLLQVRIEEFAPQLCRLEANDPVANHVQRLLGEDLPALVGSYTSIPDALTRQQHAGSTPIEQLQAGLASITRELERIGTAAAAGQLDALAIRSRYLDARGKAIGLADRQEH